MGKFRWDSMAWRRSSESTWRKDRPSARLIGRLDGLTLARGRVDDRLHSRDGSLAALTNNDGSWGYSRLDLESKESEFQSFGPQATASKMMGKRGETAASLSRSDYGTILVTFAEIGPATAQVCCEIRGTCQGSLRSTILEICP